MKRLVTTFQRSIVSLGVFCFIGWLIVGVAFQNAAAGPEYPPINALFDSYHANNMGAGVWYENNYPGEFSSSYLTSPITYEKLKEYNLFVFSANFKRNLGPRPTEDEAQAILKYAEKGGGVLIFGEDNYWNLWTNDYTNVLSTQFGVFFNTDRLLDPTNYDTSVWGSEGGAQRHIVVHNITEHPTTAGVNNVILHGSASLINNNPAGVVVLAGDDDTYSDVYPGYPPGSYPPMAIALEHGSGRIFFIGDGGWLGDVYDNKLFMINILKWLAGPIKIEVDLDIKPGSDLNSINPRSKGTIPVAILSTESFNAPEQVDKDSLTFGRTGDEESLHRRGRSGVSNCSAEDVNDDNLLDLVCHFETLKTDFQEGDTDGILKGQTVDGTPIEGQDSVRIVLPGGRGGSGQSVGTELRVSDILATPNPVAAGGYVDFVVLGQGIAEIQVEVFNLAGARVYDSGFVSGNTLSWNLTANAGDTVANGVYLYVVTVRGFNGEVVRSQVRKLVVLR